MQQYDFTAPANSPFQVGAAGRYIKYLTGSNGGGDASLQITPGHQGGAKIVLQPGQAYRIDDAAGVPDSWTLANAAGGATITGKVVIGNGRIDDSTVQGIVQVVDGGKARTMSGSAFIMAPGAPASPGNLSSVQLWNPVGSGKNAIIEKIALSCGSVSEMDFGFAAAALTTLNGTGRGKFIGQGYSSVSQSRSQNSAASLITNVMGSVYVQASSTMLFPFSEPIVLQPGYGLIVQSSAPNMNVIGMFEFFEENV